MEARTAQGGGLVIGGRGVGIFLRIAAALGLAGCATQAQTGQALSAAGTAAVVTGAVLSNNPCWTNTSTGERECARGKGEPDKVGVLLAATGVGVAAVGQALQNDAARLDARRQARAASHEPARSLPAPGSRYLPERGPAFVQGEGGCWCAVPTILLPALPPPREGGPAPASATPSAAATSSSAASSSAASSDGSASSSGTARASSFGVWSPDGACTCPTRPTPDPVDPSRAGDASPQAEPSGAPAEPQEPAPAP